MWWCGVDWAFSLSFLRLEGNFVMAFEMRFFVQGVVPSVPFFLTIIFKTSGFMLCFRDFLFLSTQFFSGKKEILRDYRFGFFLKKDTGQEGVSSSKEI